MGYTFLEESEAQNIQNHLSFINDFILLNRKETHATVTSLQILGERNTMIAPSCFNAHTYTAKGLFPVGKISWLPNLSSLDARNYILNRTINYLIASYEHWRAYPGGLFSNRLANFLRGKQMRQSHWGIVFNNKGFEHKEF